MIKIATYFFPNIITCILGLVFLRNSGYFHKRVNKLFMGAIVSDIALIFCDAVKLINDNPSLPAIFRTLPYSLSFICRATITLFVSLIALDTVSLKKKYVVIMIIPSVLNAVFALLSNFLPLVFTLEADYSFSKASFYFVPFIASGFYLGTMVFMSIISYRHHDYREGLGVVVCIIADVIATVLEAWYGYVGLLSGAAIVSLMFYYITLHGSTGTRDILTGCFSRERYYLDRTAKNICAVMMIDLNGLKTINDTKGHAEGDRILIKLSEILLSQSNRNCSVYRIGGDEFSILFRKTNENTVSEIMNKIKKTAEKKNCPCSAGYCMTSDEKDIVDTCNVADHWLYLDKAEYKKTHGIKTSATFQNA